MKSLTKNSKKNTDNINTNNDSEKIEMQKKIKDQAKRLISMQEYINTLETTLRENNQSINSKNLEENNIETNIIKNDLKECLNFLREKLLKKESEEKKGNDAYNEILEEILKIKEENIRNIEEKNIMKEKIDEYEQSLGDLKQNMDLINKLNNENNNLYNQNIIIGNELNEIKNIYVENQKEINKLKEQNYLLIKDNEELNNILNNLQMQLNEAINENNSLKDYKLGYELVIKENNEIKEINNYLSNDNMLFAQDVYILKNNINKLMETGNNNEKIRAELEDLKSVLNNLKNRKQINNIFEHISDLEQKNKYLEEQLNKKEINNKNKKDYMDNMIYNYNNINNNNDKKNKNDANVKSNNRNKDNKYILANKYYSDILLRILKYHVKDDINVKNILFQLLDLNHKKIILMTEIENLMINNKSKDINKKRNEINKKKKELQNLQNTIDFYDRDLKKYE